MNVRNLVLGFAGALFATGLILSPGSAAERMVKAPPPLQDEAGPGTSETIILAGGCFWGVQGVFQHMKGVTRAESGYAGGSAETARYERVGGGDTGHAESVAVTFDPRVVSLGTILQVYFSVAHDPTQLNRQGPDVGSQYRSAIFVSDAKQAEIAKAYIAQLDAANIYGDQIVTTVGSAPGFYPAEAYHQDYATLHPDNRYIAYNDLPKIAGLKELFPDLYRDEPVLIGASN